MKRSPQIVSLLEESARKYREASIVETSYDHRDTFDRAFSRVSVELTHGTWSTFAYRYRGMGDPSWRQHPSRETARQYAREWLS